MVVQAIADLVLRISGGSIYLVVLLAGLFVAITTALGSLSAFLSHRLPEGGVEFSMAFASGIMIVASFTSLILPGMEYAGFGQVAAGIVVGAALVFAIERLVPHEHLVQGYEGPEHLRRKLKVAWLIALAVMIHNFPEGMAVGVSIVHDVPTGLATAIAIGLQDFPEGAVVSLPLAAASGGVAFPILLGVLSGVSEAVTALLSAYFFTRFSILLPYGLGAAGGAMLYITIKEVVPEVYAHKGREFWMTLGFFAGFLLMLYLDSSL